MRTEKICYLLFIVGTTFKLMHWPGGSALVVLSLSVISVLYFPLGFYFLRAKSVDKELPNNAIDADLINTTSSESDNIWIYVISGIFLSIVPIGVMFKLLHWPGSGVLLLTGFVTCSVLTSILFYLNKSGKQKIASSLLSRCVVLLIVALVYYIK